MMKRVKLILGISAFALASMVAASTAHADDITVKEWAVTAAQASNFTSALTGINSSDLDVSAGFNYTGTGFSLLVTGSGALPYTLGGFLTTGTPVADTTTYSATNCGGPCSPTTTLDNTLWRFTATGLFVNGQTYSVTSDDGVIIIVDGITEVNDGNPQSATPNTFTWTGAPGTTMQSVTIDYGECCGAPAQLATNIDFVAPVPEPGSLVMLGSGLIGLAGLRRRKLAA